ncbi:uncharacterized protein A4U43_C09F16080 [Asparagus officinalis]|uniref:Uncharacterized protein n=1 Tax=Asparagus officinalis TaxID=4686 RepID=A0A5P1E7W7_ASPOF|nr:uncharacterized protein A4U43_C09F16080 [Asparagus officinalis]
MSSAGASVFTTHGMQYCCQRRGPERPYSAAYRMSFQSIGRSDVALGSYNHGGRRTQSQSVAILACVVQLLVFWPDPGESGGVTWSEFESQLGEFYLVGHVQILFSFARVGLPSQNHAVNFEIVVTPSGYMIILKSIAC